MYMLSFLNFKGIDLPAEQRSLSMVVLLHETSCCKMRYDGAPKLEVMATGVPIDPYFAAAGIGLASRG